MFVLCIEIEAEAVDPLMSDMCVSQWSQKKPHANPAIIGHHAVSIQCHKRQLFCMSTFFTTAVTLCIHW